MRAHAAHPRTLLHMDATRTERVTVNLTPGLAARLDAFAALNHWTRSTAAALLIENGLPQEDKP